MNLSIFQLIICEMTKTRFPAAWIVMSTLPSLAGVFFARPAGINHSNTGCCDDWRPSFLRALDSISEGGRALLWDGWPVFRAAVARRNSEQESADHDIPMAHEPSRKYFVLAWEKPEA